MLEVRWATLIVAGAFMGAANIGYPAFSLVTPEQL